MTAFSFAEDHIVIRHGDPREAVALQCLNQYYEELARTFEHGFEVEQSRNPPVESMMPPYGAFFVAWADQRPIGCVGLKGNGMGEAEVKRLWVSPSARGSGLGRRLMQKVEEVARSLSITVLRLDTNRALPEALQLYHRTGWTQIDRFNDDPYADFFFEKTVQT